MSGAINGEERIRHESKYHTLRRPTHYCSTALQPSKSLTVAQVGPPSRPVPGTRASSTPPVRIIFAGMPSRGTLSLRLQQDSVCPAYVPMSTYTIFFFKQKTAY